MRRLPLVVLVSVWSLACGGRGSKSATDGPAAIGDAGLPGDLAPVLTDGPRDEAVRDAAVVDAPASTCSGDGGCADGQTCWLAPSGAHTCEWFGVPPPSPTNTTCDGGVPTGGGGGACCTHDDQCTQGVRGRCQEPILCGGAVPPHVSSSCAYNAWCRDDGDCVKGTTCTPISLTGAQLPQCLGGACRTSADCTRAPGGECVVYRQRQCFSYASAFYCQYPGDVCRIGSADRDCATDAGVVRSWVCVPRPDGHGTRCQQDFGRPP